MAVRAARGAGCALVRDPEMLRAAFAYHPPYHHFEERVTNYVDYGPQNSRGFRALKVWLALKHAGAAGYRNMIAEDIRLSQAMAQAVSRHEELQLMTQELSITTFRYVPRNLRAKLRESEIELHLDALNRELVDRPQRLQRCTRWLRSPNRNACVFGMNSSCRSPRRSMHSASNFRW